MKYFIALDSGGTKTDAVLCDETGHILSRVLDKGCNAGDLGFPVARVRLADIMDRLLAGVQHPVAAVYAGIAGASPKSSGFPQDVLLPRIGSEAILQVANDGPMLITGMLGRADGCGMIAGTGSSLFVRQGGQIVSKIGGRGYLVDTGGSAFEIGRDGIAAAYRALDGQSEHTMLVEMLEQAMGFPVMKAHGHIYDKENGGRRYIASFARVVFDAWRQGDWAATAIIEEGARKQASLVKAAAKLFPGDFTVVLNGGVHLNVPDYAPLIQALVPQRAHLVRSDVPPVFGALLEAMYDAGLDPDPHGSIRQQFMADYARRN